MNKPFILSCCTTADLTEEQYQANNLRYIRFHYLLDGEEHYDNPADSMDAFYNAMAHGAETKTSQINTAEFIEYFTGFLEDGRDILHVSLSSGISGTYNAAYAAKEILSERFPERKIIIIDSLAASAGYGLLMDRLSALRNDGYRMEELAAWAEVHKTEIHHWFFSGDLTFYIKGGRISKGAGYLGTVLKICPLLHVDETGHLVVWSKIRTKKKAIAAMAEKMAAYAKDGGDYNGNCFISHSACLADAKAVAALVEEKFPQLKGKIVINNIGTTIGSHTGPGTVALFFWGSHRGAEEE
ncbi:MAG TPA: DegV family protein [Clostridiales bacterium]|nr:DegV family protein [Clostridiales bacterium]